MLDVGADEGLLGRCLPTDVNYVGIGLGGSNSNVIPYDLEQLPLPFESDSFDCVVCSDVLEHLENMHAVFDDLCRLSNRHVLLSLPNPLQCVYRCMQGNPHSPERYTKFYGLPPEREADRHRWFFTPSEARRFVRYRASKNGCSVLLEHQMPPQDPGNYSLATTMKIRLRLLLLRFFSGLDIQFIRRECLGGSLWWVLNKQSAQ